MQSMPNIGIPEMLIVLVIALVVLGPKKLPDAGRSLGHGLKSFKDAITGNDDDAPELTSTTAARTEA
jgi:sec-independent protein translocase protein TatA